MGGIILILLEQISKDIRVSFVKIELIEDLSLPEQVQSRPSILNLLTSIVHLFTCNTLQVVNNVSEVLVRVIHDVLSINRGILRSNSAPLHPKSR